MTLGEIITQRSRAAVWPVATTEGFCSSASAYKALSVMNTGTMSVGASTIGVSNSAIASGCHVNR